MFTQCVWVCVCVSTCAHLRCAVWDGNQRRALQEFVLSFCSMCQPIEASCWQTLFLPFVIWFLKKLDREVVQGLLTISCFCLVLSLAWQLCLYDMRFNSTTSVSRLSLIFPEWWVVFNNIDFVTCVTTKYVGHFLLIILCLRNIFFSMFKP